MYINKLVKVYNANFGFLYGVKETLNRSKLILIPLISLIVMPIIFYISYFIEDIPFRMILMIASITTFGVSTIWASHLQKKTIQDKYGSIEELEKQKFERLEVFISKELHITELEHYTLLEELVNKKIEEMKESTTFPFSGIIRQLFIAALTIGLLSYSFNQLNDGNSELGSALFMLYFMIMGTLAFIGIIISNSREFTRKHKLKQISMLITEIQLKKSVNNKKKIIILDK